ncbi:DNA internalization-related competence protein ComEC/Rec2 [Ferrimonas balearica]|nr:DNA internalization-related competence protein ComEC/Rec2 [Ferrimonas balearica]
MTLGLVLLHCQAHRLVHPERPLSPGTVTLVATVASLPTGDEIYQRSDWQVEQIDGAEPAPWWPNRVRLGWYRGPPLAQGERYRLTVTLKAPHGVLNQGSGNRRRQLLADGVSATGYVREGSRLSAERHWRQSLADTLATQTATLPQGDLIRALVLADRRGLDEARWQSLRASGLMHLVAISGLHLTIVAGLCLGLGRVLLPRLWPDPAGRGRPLAWVLAALAVLGYGALAGYGLPTRRAAVMVILALALLWRGRDARPWEILLRAAALVLLFAPLAALSAGFWLSFGAVATLLLLNWARPCGQGAWARLVHLVYLQSGLTLVLVAIQGFWFGSYTLNALWANLLILPLFSLLILPVCLLCGLLALAVPQWAPVLLQWADWSLAPLVWVAEASESASSHWPWLAGPMPGSAWWMLALLLLALVLVVLRPWRGWAWQGALLCLPLASALAFPAPGWRLHLLDVGQGLAAVVERQGRYLLYDTGAAFPSGYSYARQVVLPFLHARGASELDLLVVSHGDNDHAGGLDAITGAMPVAHHLGYGGAPCHRGPSHWQGLRLSWWQANLAGNNGSCTLRIDDGRHSLMLPGDMESAAERRMLNAGAVGPSTVLVSPHHGSASSSSAPFVQALAPQWVLVPAGWGNRWGFPKAAVRARYEALDSQVWVSGEEGQITVHFPPEGAVRAVSYRRHRAPWWYNRQ